MEISNQNVSIICFSGNFCSLFLRFKRTRFKIIVKVDFGLLNKFCGNKIYIALSKLHAMNNFVILFRCKIKFDDGVTSSTNIGYVIPVCVLGTGQKVKMKLEDGCYYDGIIKEIET